MLVTYPARFEDRFGCTETTLLNDGHRLRMMLRGVEMASSTLDDWEAVSPLPPGSEALFSLAGGTLRSFCLSFAHPIQVDVGAQTRTCELAVRIEVGGPAPNGGVDRLSIELRLTLEGQAYASSPVDDFESALAHIARSLPEAAHLRCCFGCAFSDYSPVGQDLFGTLACFRGARREYAAAGDKQAFLDLFPDHVTEWVQETSLCPDFERRRAGTGYRG